MTRRPLDPRLSNITIDNNALDKNGTARDALIDRLMTLQQSGEVNIVVPRGVRSEALHPYTPSDVRQNIGSQIFAIQTALTAPEREQLRKVETVLQGNAQPAKHKADANHLFEAGKYGGGYFITNDGRILDKRDELSEASALPPTLSIVTLEEFFEIFEDFEQGRRI
jgi:hypothetical protein